MLPSVSEGSRLDAANTRLAGAMSRRLVDDVARSSSRRGSLAPAAAAATVLATIVHLVTLAVAVSGGWLLVEGHGWPLKVVGVLLLAIFAVLLPRPGRAVKGPGLLSPTDCPATAALVREVAALVGTRIPDRLEIDHDLNASASIVRWRRQVLTVGAPLWVALSPQARVALLAHELGHFAHGDVRQSRYIGFAFAALGRWIDFATPRSFDGSDALAFRIVSWPVRVALSGYATLLDLCAAPSHRRQEVYADLAAVHAAGTAGAVDLLETLLAVTGLSVTVNRVSILPDRPPLAPAIADYMSGYDVAARAVARRRGDDSEARIDDTHPPTTERLRLVESVAHADAAVVLTPERQRALDREWARAVDAQLRRLSDRYRGR